MRPHHLHWAYEEGRTVVTTGGVGRARRRRLADLVLPTGELSLGYPGDGVVNKPSDVHPIVPPGRYPVFLSVAEPWPSCPCFAFLLVCFREGLPTRWEPAGSFFTDSGDGYV